MTKETAKAIKQLIPNQDKALVVQRIERRFPKPKIWVRFPSGVQNDRFW